MPTPPLRTRVRHVLTLLVMMIVSTLIVFAPLFFLAGCGNPALPAHYAGLTANRALPVLIQLEEREGDLVIAQHTEDELATDAGLAAVEARWAPFWAAWEAFVMAQRAWADAFTRHDPAAAIDAAERAATAAFCAARALLPPTVPPEVLEVAAVACRP